MDTLQTGMGAQPGNQTRYPNKRLKFSEAPASVHQGPSFTAATTTDELNKQTTDTLTAEPSSLILPPELYHIQTKYDFTTMSIISSSKIEQKVRNLLLRLEKFSFADINAKPGVVALHAKASVATKLISIVEIAKKRIMKGGGKWWQYSRLHGEITELKEKREKVKSEGSTLLEWEKKQATEMGAKSSKSDGENVDLTMDVDDALKEDEEEAAFETMNEKKQTTEVAFSSDKEPRRKIRAVPIMTIYMSRVPIVEFKGLYGYVCYRNSFASILIANIFFAVNRRMHSYVHLRSLDLSKHQGVNGGTGAFWT